MQRTVVPRMADDLDTFEMSISFYRVIFFYRNGIYKKFCTFIREIWKRILDMSICRPAPRSIPSKSWMQTASSPSSESFLCVGIHVCPADRHIWYRGLCTVSAAWIEIDPSTMLGTGRSGSESARVYVETSAHDWHPTGPLETVKTFHPACRVWPWRFVATPIILLGGFTVIRKTTITRRTHGTLFLFMSLSFMMAIDF